MTSIGLMDVARRQDDFPVLARKVHGERLVYLDSAATSQKPRAVLDAMTRFYETSNANIHRGTYQMAVESTEAYEASRRAVARFIGAPSWRGLVFTKNVTEAINLVAVSWGGANLTEGDVVVLTEIEHHANLVPWMMLRDRIGIELRFIPMAEDFSLDLTHLDQLLDGAKLIAFSAMSNVLGTLTPIRRIVDAAHAAGALALVDGAQLVPHVPTDIAALDVDFFGFTGHKMCGPTGIGGLWARPELLEAMPPFLGGGEMIRDVRLEGFTTAEVPTKFEAGTMPFAEAVGLHSAVEYLSALGMDAVREHEVSLTGYAMRALRERHGDDITIYGPSDPTMRGGALSFTYKGIHPHDVSQVLDQKGICVRAGHHCAKPLMRRLGVGATTRASLYLYNDEADVDALVDGLADVDDLFSL